MINLLLGDARFFWSENIKFLAHIPYAWDSSLNTGVGISQINTLWITSYLNFTAYFISLGLSWPWIYILFWVLPAISISFLSSFFLFRLLINKKPFFAILSGIIFTTNTYFLLLFFGGQSGVCLAYAFIPLVFLVFIKLLRSPSFYQSVLAGLVFAFQILFDPRLAGLTIVSLLLFYLVRFQFSKKDVLFFAIIPFALVFLLHSFWILPLIFYRSNIIPEGFTTLAGVTFLSFARLENTISLLHPNWPENIFGKVSFMRPEFILLPLIAFASLLFVRSKVRKNAEHYAELRRNVLFFSVLGLISAFLAKGTNEPFGQIFLWFVNSIPGFSVFRDSTKFYTLIAFAYAILIPYSILSISEKFKKVFPPKLPTIIFLLFWLFSLRLLFTVPVFQNHQLPGSYVQLKDFIVSQHQSFRTLWIPSLQRYGYFSDTNPAIGRGELFKEASASGMIKQMSHDKMLPLLQDLSVKYIIVPQDSVGEIFLNDRKYDERLYKKTVSDVEKIQGLTKVKTFEKIVVFEIPHPRDRFWNPSKNNALSISYKMINPTRYEVSVKSAKKGDVVVFSEGFDPNWAAKNAQFTIQSSQYGKKLNSFILSEEGTYSFSVSYQPQRLVNVGLIVSGITFIGIIVFLVRKRRVEA